MCANKYRVNKIIDGIKKIIIFTLKNSKSYLSNPFRYSVDKQYAFAVILIILGLGLTQAGSNNSF